MLLFRVAKCLQGSLGSPLCLLPGGRGPISNQVILPNPLIWRSGVGCLRERGPPEGAGGPQCCPELPATCSLPMVQVSPERVQRRTHAEGTLPGSGHLPLDLTHFHMAADTLAHLCLSALRVAFEEKSLPPPSQTQAQRAGHECHPHSPI